MPDYHTKPVLAARVNAESLAWARGEAERRGQSFGDFIDALITTEKAKATNQAARVGLRVTEISEEQQP